MQVDLGRANYKTLFELHETARVAVTAQSADLKVFEQPAVSRTPVSPRSGPALLFGAAGGSGAGVLAILVGMMLGVVAVPENAGGSGAARQAPEREDKSAAV